MYESVEDKDFSPVLNLFFAVGAHAPAKTRAINSASFFKPPSEHISPSNRSSCQEMIKLLTKLFVTFSDKSLFSYLTLRLQEKEETFVQLLTWLIVVTETDYFKKKLIGVCPHWQFMDLIKNNLQPSLYTTQNNAIAS